MERSRFDPAIDYLASVDPVLSDLIARVGPCTLARSRNHFLTLVRAIVWQQLSWSAACAIHERVLDTIGVRQPRPTDVLDTPENRLLSAGLSRQKVVYLRDLSLFFEQRRFPPNRISRLGDEEIIDLLCQIKGVGRWTAEMFLIFALNRQDVFPFGDLGLRKAIARHYAQPLAARPEELEPVTDPWRPYRTIAAWYLWRAADGVVLDDKR